VIEIIGLVFWGVVQFFAELVLQIVFELVVDLLGHGIRRKGVMPVSVATLACAAAGAIAGGVSLVIFPRLFIQAQWLRALNIIVTPVVAGLFMGAVGSWLRRRDRSVSRLDSFAYGYVFALTMAAVRVIWGQ
jgi:hypothetical protein